MEQRQGVGSHRYLDEWEIEALLWAAAQTRYPERNKAIVLLACDAGLSAREIAHLRRYHLLTDRGVLGDFIELYGLKRRFLKDRRIFIGHKTRLWWALHDVLLNAPGVSEDPVVISERAIKGGGATKSPGEQELTPMRPTSIGYVFWKLMEKAGVDAPTNCGRNTFLVHVSKRVKEREVSIHDMQEMAGYRSIYSTKRFLEYDHQAQRRMMHDLLDPLFHNDKTTAR